MSSSSEVILWRDQFVRSQGEARRERKRARRRIIGVGLASGSVLFGSVLVAASMVNSPSIGAAVEPVPTTLPMAPEWMAPTTTVPTPQSVPTSIAPLWITPRVAVPGFDGLGKLVTDGYRAKARILPGDIGRAVIGIPVDPSSAATVIVEGVRWTVFNRGGVASTDLAAITGPVPTEPVVLIVSTLPGDTRPFVEARR